MTDSVGTSGRASDADAGGAVDAASDVALADDALLDEVAGGYPHHHREGTTAADGILGWFGG